MDFLYLHYRPIERCLLIQIHFVLQIGQPVQLSRMPAELTHPSYATLVGMLLYAHRKRVTRTAENNSLRAKLRAIFAASL